VHVHQAVHVAIRRRPQNHLVDQREYGHVQADAQRQRDHRDRRETRPAPQRPQGQPEVPRQLVQRAPSPSLPAGLLQRRRVPKPPHRRIARLFAGHAAGAVLFGLHIEVRLHFLGEVAVQPVAVEEYRESAN